MKFTKIFKTTAVALGAVVALSGCIRETLPQESAITESQLGSGNMEFLVKGISSGMLSYISGWEHTDFGYHSVGVYNDNACKLVTTSGYLVGQPEGYNRFYASQYSWGYAANSSLPSHVWYNYYPQIKSCNDIIGAVAGDEVNRTAEAFARTYRALFYLDLARMFECLYAEAPENPDYEAQQFKVAGLTVPIVDENTTEEAAKNNPRATREEIFNFIFADLAFAEEALADYQQTSPTNPTLAVVYGLYARAYLWLGGFTDGLNGELPEGNAAYAKAAEYARMAINAHGGAVMSLPEWTDPKTGFNTFASSWMWALVQSSDTVINNLFQFSAHMCPEAAYGYAPMSCPSISEEAYNRLSDTDFRKLVIKGPETTFKEFRPFTLVETEEEFDSFAPWTCFKFRPAQGERNDYKTAGASTLPLMRCEEMYFIEMEALFHTSGFDAALPLLTSFMANRDSNYVVTSSSLLEEIIFQKSMEFWGEGILMYDMKRLDMGVDTSKSENYAPDARFKTEGRLPWWTYCIPQAETQINLATSDYNNPNPSQAYKPGDGRK